MEARERSKGKWCVGDCKKVIAKMNSCLLSCRFCDLV